MKRIFWEMLKEDVENEANILGSRFILCIKDINTVEEKYKVRFVVQVHTNHEKNALIHSFPRHGKTSYDQDAPRNFYHPRLPPLDTRRDAGLPAVRRNTVPKRISPGNLTVQPYLRQVTRTTKAILRPGRQWQILS